MQDPVRDRLLTELRGLRRAPGNPSIERLTDKFELVEALGMGDTDRAWQRLDRLHEQHGTDPETDIGAYFYLAGWNVGRDTLDRRIRDYAAQFHVRDRTALRRGDRGALKLAALIRDEAETARPWGLVTLFQSGNAVDVIVRLMLGFESWRPATIRVNGNDVSDPQFTIHRNPDVEGNYFHQLIVEGVELDLNASKHSPMATIFIHWPMPVWPTWQTVAYVADPLILVRTRTFRDRGIELRLEWSREAPARDCGPLMTDQRMWVERTGPRARAVHEGRAE
ncbi:hypothetical protein [Antrihabitans spumae]|uniref:Uncharacterized protein n=1 Tax=Antrihabitans spumae TaxID=3373370 RepID=A0ABW7K6Z5_9NOCA